jgi:dTDP-4-amino-4,6-dideoxygalactose transaminase
MLKEIGSEYWLSELSEANSGVQLPLWLEKWSNLTLTSSGRGAITLAIESISEELISKTALLPAYCCHTMIDPFLQAGFEVFFYDIKKENLEPDIESIERYSDKNIGVVLHMGFYGFETNKCLYAKLKEFKNTGTKIIEDVTHTLFSDFRRNEISDFYVSSIRKWMGIPSGGFCSSKADNYVCLKSDDEFSSIRIGALKKKSEFIKTGDENFKPLFLDLFRSAEAVLDKKPEPYSIDQLSLAILNRADVKNLMFRRRENYSYLSQFLTKNTKLQLVFQKLPENVCPLFLPVYVEDCRDEFKNKLIESKIYAPIHWPRPAQVDYSIFAGANNILENIISIPIDQRYSLAEMDRIAYIIRDYN